MIQLRYAILPRRALKNEPPETACVPVGQGILVSLWLEKCRAALYTDCTQISGTNPKSRSLGLILLLTFIAPCFPCSWGYVIVLE